MRDTEYLPWLSWYFGPAPCAMRELMLVAGGGSCQEQIKRSTLFLFLFSELLLLSCISLWTLTWSRSWYATLIAWEIFYGFWCVDNHWFPGTMWNHIDDWNCHVGAIVMFCDFPFFSDYIKPTPIIHLKDCRLLE